ncbi:hypothetical protein CBQ26_14230 [Deinococcus indicus]|uniref:Uncharacterized protein n=1 Tax=Deinococcus indicus TaxID=223556 RepID=A0A246BI16_9DEIO|nr:hypothetical protein [Deinococcus indicus]OWL94861.1 hypothetical protein CBQ26_14230 [Deinococcus indicus]
MARRTSRPVVLTAGFVGVMVFTVSVAEVAPDLRGGAALGLLISALLSMQGLRSAPGGSHHQFRA